MLHRLSRGILVPKLHPWMSWCWSNSSFQNLGPTTETNRHSSTLSGSTIPICNSFRKSWVSGSPRTWQRSWACQTATKMISVQLTSTAYLLNAWSRTERGITCTPITLWSLNRICIEELCVHGAIPSIWTSIGFVARMLRCVPTLSIDFYMMCNYKSYDHHIPHILKNYSVIWHVYDI